MKVRITDKRMPRRIGVVGDVVDVPERYARAWLHRGFAALPDDDQAVVEAQADAGSFEDMNYNDLRSLVSERGLKPKGRKKVDLIAALESPEKYRRRDMRAED